MNNDGIDSNYTIGDKDDVTVEEKKRTRTILGLVVNVEVN